MGQYALGAYGSSRCSYISTSGVFSGNGTELSNNEISGLTEKFPKLCRTSGLKKPN